MIEYEILTLSQDEYIFNNKEYIYWVILYGEGVLIIPDSSEHLIKARESVRIAEFGTYRFVPSGTVAIGCIRLSEVFGAVRRFQHLDAHHAELIRKIFLLAIDIQGYDIPNRNAMLLTVSQLMFDAIRGAGVAVDPINPYVHKVLEDIDRNLPNADYDLAASIAQTGYTPAHFRRLFKKETGLPPGEHLTFRRIEYARKLIEQLDNRISIREIGESCGFKDSAYFSRQFRKWMGMPPTQYLERCKRKADLNRDV